MLCKELRKHNLLKLHVFEPFACENWIMANLQNVGGFHSLLSVTLSSNIGVTQFL